MVENNMEAPSKQPLEDLSKAQSNAFILHGHATVDPEVEEEDVEIDLKAEAIGENNKWLAIAWYYSYKRSNVL